MTGSMKRSEKHLLQIPDKALRDDIVRIEVGEDFSGLRVEAGASSRVRIGIFFGTLPKSAEDLHASFEFFLGPLAYVDLFYVLPGDTPQDALISKSEYYLKKHSSLNVWTFAGRAKAQMEHQVYFKEEHAFASLNGLSVLGDEAVVDHKICAHHEAGACISRQFYKSIVTDQARSGFNSLVRVSHGANRSDSRQLNRNLILSKKARASSKPELEIHADDVSCSHGSATGELDPSEIFYLRSRGLDERAARTLLIRGFAGEVLEELPKIPFKTELSDWVEEQLCRL